MNSIQTRLSTVLFFCSFIIVAGLKAQHLPDATIKKNIESINNSLQQLIRLQPKTYEYNVSDFKYLKLQKGKHYGFVAEDVEAVFPGFVKERTISYMFGKNAYRNVRIKEVDEMALIPVLVASIKEQQSEIEKLKAALEDLKSGQVSFVN